MKVNLKTKCPCCGSKEIHTLELDQFCLNCDWINALDLVVSGQFEDDLEALELPLKISIHEPQAQTRTA